MFKVSPGCDEGMPTGRCIPPILDLDCLAVLVEHWMDRCATKHAVCASALTEDQRPLPTRVLELNTDGQSVRLVESNGATGRYISLSHCWGLHKPIKSMKANLAAHKIGIETADLPKTFQDTVQVAHCLRIRYIWIDSLCIVQDDPADWEREAASMGNVYVHSHITLAASRAGGSDVGFLHARNEDKVVEIRNDVAGQVYIGTLYSFADDVDNAPLNDRAWALQERILSRRTLHFTDNQVYWECWGRHQGEDLANANLGVSKQYAYPQILAPGYATMFNELNPAGTRDHWWHLISSYTARKLTYQKDRLVAISGLIDRITEATFQKSVAGIPGDDLHAGVLWVATDEGLSLQQEGKYPSWSWASRTKRINNVQLDDYMLNTREVTLTSTSVDGSATLAVKHRSLRQGVSATDTKHSSNYEEDLLELNHFPTKFRFLAPDVSDDEADLGWLVLDEDHGSEVDLSRFGFAVTVSLAYGDDRDEKPDDVQRTAPGNGRFWKGPFYCLVLQHLIDETYIRVGVAYVPYMEWFMEGSTNANVI